LGRLLSAGGPESEDAEHRERYTRGEGGGGGAVTVGAWSNIGPGRGGQDEGGSEEESLHGSSLGRASPSPPVRTHYPSAAEGVCFGGSECSGVERRPSSFVL